MQNLLKNFDDYKIIAVPEGTAILLIKKYIPFSNCGIDAYYLASNSLFKQTRELGKTLQQQGFGVLRGAGKLPFKTLALQSGLADFVGLNSLAYRNDCGSFFAISALLLQDALTPTINNVHKEQAEFAKCSMCYKCVKACPNGAIDKQSGFTRNNCLRHIMQYDKQNIDDKLKQKIGGRILGCNTCQTVCPHNSHIVLVPAPQELQYAIAAAKNNPDALAPYIGENYVNLVDNIQ